MLKIDPNDRSTLIEPLFRASPRFYAAALVLLAVIGWGGIIYVRQFLVGLEVTGMQRPAYWGIYMVNFVFFIGISHAGTLISAILRVTQAEWRRPITRVAEAITVFALAVGTLQILFDIGRPDRLLYVFAFGRLQSPLLWDVVSVTSYFLGSVTYLYLPLIPDAAILRDNLPPNAPAWRRRLYTLLALGWRGNRTQWLRLERVIAVMAILIIPIAVSVHTIISWILATTVQPGWHSTIFGPYFVVGAIFSGIGALFIAMSAIRRAFHLEAYITEKQYQLLGYLLIAMTAIWFYFTYAEHLTLAAGQQEAEFPIFASKLWGEFAPSFWLMVGLMVVAFCVLVLPGLIPAERARAPVFRPRFTLATAASSALALMLATLSPIQPVTASLGNGGTRTALLVVTVAGAIIAGISLLPWLKRHFVARTVIASICVVIGMWLERWTIFVPTLTHPRLIAWGVYVPTMTELSLTAASFALFALLFLVFFKLFPPVSVWEVAEGRVIEQAHAKTEIPMPESSGTVRRGWRLSRR
jgi:molybdopterin-containing oxidoreductase family membrane subunit